MENIAIDQAAATETRAVSFTELHGQDTAKRAIEIALVASHPIVFTPRAGYGGNFTQYDTARLDGESLALARHWQAQFPAGNATGIEAAEKMVAYCLTAMFELARDGGFPWAGETYHLGEIQIGVAPGEVAPMCIEIQPLSLVDLLCPAPSESVEMVIARIHAARARRGSIGELTHQARELWRKFAEYVKPDADVAVKIIEVARSIQALAYTENEIGRMALAEALSYFRHRPRDTEGSPNSDDTALPHSPVEPLPAVIGPDMPAIALSEAEIEPEAASNSMGDASTAEDWLAADARISPQHDRDEADAVSAGNHRKAGLIAYRRRQWRAALAARLEELETRVATLSWQSEGHRLQHTSPEETAALLYGKHGVRMDLPIEAIQPANVDIEVNRAKRGPAHERAIRRAWALRAERNKLQAAYNASGDRNRDLRKQADDWEGEAQRGQAKRRRSTLLARQRGQQMGMIAALAHKQAAEIEAVKLAPTYFNAETGLEQADHTARAAHHARTAIDKAERVTGELGEARAAMARMQGEIERLADSMVTENMRALRAEAALAAITARANGWPPAVQCVTVKFAA